MRPNIFKLATGELTNDAMICWLVSWIGCGDSEYESMSKDVISLFIDNNNITIKNVNTIQQYKKIDVMIEVNNDQLIIVEDKINTSHHSDQLNRYKEDIENDERYKSHKKHYIYLKLGNESVHKAVDEAGYKRISRAMILNVIEKYRMLNNNLLSDYIEYLEEKEEGFKSYENIESLEPWSWSAWEGYYSKLQEEKNIDDWCWSYVSNKSGGFLGFYWNFKEMKYKYVDYNLYPQIESNPNTNLLRIAFKISCENKNLRSEIRNHIWSKIKDFNCEHINKTIFRNGKYMTVGEISNINTYEDLKKSVDLAEEILNRIVDTKV